MAEKATEYRFLLTAFCERTIFWFERTLHAGTIVELPILCPHYSEEDARRLTLEHYTEMGMQIKSLKRINND